MCSCHTLQRAPLSLVAVAGSGSKCLSAHMPRMPLAMGSFSASRALLGIWGSESVRQEMLMKQEKGTEVPDGDL